MKFVKVDEDVVSVELSLDTVGRIARALSLVESEYDGTDLLDERDKSLSKVFTTASQRFAESEEEPLAEWERLLLEGPASE
ncbi:hypothetical protein SEA_BILLNYE_124 [Streptomyces phage BillNye]|uniref:Uncharacterized protein n=1 Tax=Streptomyces phage BillNye TaxID=2079426 RepID=A0A2L1IVU4_9CAUD|nr:hypothetical protein FDJ30_gp132 [Streptomyces phage BillNye]AVD99301.1 hypothetical protein SEA_BILLNYE_124 [Streptomyces phage BillNye]